jgi:CBS domain protein
MKVLQVGAYARRDVPTCHLTHRLGEAQDRARAAGCQGVCRCQCPQYCPRLSSREVLDAALGVEVEAVMEPGPSTIRPNTFVDTALKRLEAQRQDNLQITTPDGQLIGLLFRHEIEKAKTV